MVRRFLYSSWYNHWIPWLVSFHFINEHCSEFQLGVSIEKFMRKNVKCFSNYGSQVKQYFPGWVSNTEIFALKACLIFLIFCLCVFISKSVIIHWQMPTFSMPSYKLARKFMYKKLFSSCLVTKERDTSIPACCLRSWNDNFFLFFQVSIWFGRESANLESFHGADFLKYTSSFPTKIMQAESLALSIWEQQKLLVPPAVLIKRKKKPSFVWYQRSRDKFKWQYCIL